MCAIQWVRKPVRNKKDDLEVMRHGLTTLFDD